MLSFCLPKFKESRASSVSCMCNCVQISKPDEFDCMFTCEIRAETIYHPSSASTSFAALKLTCTYWKPVELINCTGDECFVCPKAFRTDFRGQVEDILQHIDTEMKLCTYVTHYRRHIFYVTDKGLYTYSRPFIGRPFLKRFALCYQTVVRLSVLSALSVPSVCITLVYYGQTVGRIKMTLGLLVRLGPSHIVLYGDPAPPPPKGHSSQFSVLTCGQMAGWIKMSIDRQVALNPSDIVLHGYSPSQKGAQRPQFLARICCGQTTGWIKMPLGVEVGLGPGDIVLDGDPAPPPTKGHSSSPLFGPCILWSNGRPSQLLLSTCCHCSSWTLFIPMTGTKLP